MHTECLLAEYLHAECLSVAEYLHATEYLYVTECLFIYGIYIVCGKRAIKKKSQDTECNLEKTNPSKSKIKDCHQSINQSSEEQSKNTESDHTAQSRANF